MVFINAKLLIAETVAAVCVYQYTGSRVNIDYWALNFSVRQP